MGFGGAGLINLAVVLIGDFFPDTEERTHWIGRNSAAMIIALAVFPCSPVSSPPCSDGSGPWLRVRSPSSSPWSPGSCSRRRGPAVVLTVRVQLGEWARPCDTTILVTLAGGAIVFAVMFGVFLATLPTHLEDDFGLGAGWRGLVIGLPAVTSSLTAFNLGRIHRGVPTGLIPATSTAWVVAFVLIGLSPILLFLPRRDPALWPRRRSRDPQLADGRARRALKSTEVPSWRRGQRRRGWARRSVPHRGRDPGDRGQRMGAGWRRGCR